MNNVTTKDKLLGIKVKIKSYGQYSRLRKLCEELGIYQATWAGCNYNEQRNYGMLISHEGNLVVTNQVDWLEVTEETSEEFLDLREVDYESIDFTIAPPRVEEPSFEVGQQVTISNSKGYNLGEFGEQFLGEICTVRSLFESSNVNEGSIEVVVVSLEDGTCGCFRSDMVGVKEPEPTWQDTLSEYVLSTDLPYSCNGSKHITAFNWDGDEEVFLEMCRIALRAKGEIE